MEGKSDPCIVTKELAEYCNDAVTYLNAFKRGKEREVSMISRFHQLRDQLVIIMKKGPMNLIKLFGGSFNAFVAFEIGSRILKNEGLVRQSDVEEGRNYYAYERNAFNYDAFIQRCNEVYDLLESRAPENFIKAKDLYFRLFTSTHLLKYDPRLTRPFILENLRYMCDLIELLPTKDSGFCGAEVEEVVTQILTFYINTRSMTIRYPFGLKFRIEGGRVATKNATSPEVLSKLRGYKKNALGLLTAAMENGRALTAGDLYENFIKTSGDLFEVLDSILDTQFCS